MGAQIFIDTPLESLLSVATDYKERGWRLANICGSDVDGKVELLYSFAQGEELENLRVIVANEDTVPAVSPLYPGAFVFENETHELYGVNIEGITIDFKGAFYPTSIPTPMNPSSQAAEAFLGSEEDSRG